MRLDKICDDFDRFDNKDIIDICANCTLPHCIEGSSGVCKRFKEMRAKLGKGLPQTKNMVVDGYNYGEKL